MLQTVQIPRLRASLANYYVLTKPKIWYLLVFTSFGAMIAAGGLSVSPILALLVVTSVTLGSAGSNVLTSYLDRDMDAIMERTKQRPIPTGKITPLRALEFGLLLAVLSITGAVVIDFSIGYPLVSVIMALGMFDNIIVYSAILKRRTMWNIIAGGFSGAAPALIGYAAVTGTIDLKAILISSLVFVWIPAHIWSLSLKYKTDYAKVGVPMLPVVLSERTSIRIIATSSILIVAFSLALYFVGSFGLLYLFTASLTGAVVLVLGVQLVAKPSEEKAWRLFKFTSPYLALLFIAMIIEGVIGGLL
ncbi:MAG: heme o synthase [Nitrososphaerales archaeon]